jgi:hypothetical protein
MVAQWMAHSVDASIPAESRRFKRLSVSFMREPISEYHENPRGTKLYLAGGQVIMTDGLVRRYAGLRTLAIAT